MIEERALALIDPVEEKLIEMATNGLEDNTRLAYSRHLKNFIGFIHRLGPGNNFSRQAVQTYKQYLMDQDYAPSTVNQALTAIRRMADEAKYMGFDPVAADGILAVKSVAKAGRRIGHWLSPDQMKMLFDCTERLTLKGHQERLVLALLGGCALRRSEASDLEFEQIQERDGTTLIVDLVGKGNKTRSIPIPPWALKLLNIWKEAAEIDSGLVLRAVDKTGKLTGQVKTKGGGLSSGGLSRYGIYKIVGAVAGRCGIEGLAPHSLRRTWARRAYKQGFPLDQIQVILGHASMTTTEVYIGIRGLDLESPVFVTY